LSASTVKLLRAAAEITGGHAALAERLGVDEALLSKYLADGRELPDVLLLRVVDIILTDRRPPSPGSAQLAASALRGSSGR
jgi:transcriptional regulator with XRE-family HTH domain